jgi:hypothetical protein
MSLNIETAREIHSVATNANLPYIFILQDCYRRNPPGPSGLVGPFGLDGPVVSEAIRT